MTAFNYDCRPTVTGSMPHTDPVRAVALLNRHLKDIPTWPQLPQRSFLENMYVQYAEGFPGVVVDEAARRIYVATAGDYSPGLEALYRAFLEDDAAGFGVSRERAAGLYEFLRQDNLSPLAVKGCVTGPVSWGMTVLDENKRAILYHDTLGDAVPKLLKLKAAWQEKELKKLSKNTIIFLDEPYMAAYGSSVAAGPFSSPDKVAAMIDEVFSGISGLKGLHCCGNTDWSVLLRTRMDILNFDAYSYADSVALYPDEINKFVKRGGCIAWGIVPNETGPVTKETVAGLRDRLEEAMAPFTRNGLPFKELLAQSLIMPACSLAPLSEDGAERALELLTGLSAEMRQKL